MDNVLRKINVLLVVDKFVFHGATINGPSRYYSWLLEYIDKSAFNVNVVSLRGDEGADYLFRKSGHTVIYLNSHKFNLFAFLKVVKLIKNLDIDLLHLSGYGACTLGRIAGAITNTSVIVHEHWADPNPPFYIRVVEALLARQTDHAIAISDLAKKILTQCKKLPENKVTIIRNGIPLDKFGKATEEEAQTFRDEVGCADDTPLIGMVAMLEQNKGHKYVIRAMQQITSKFPQVKLLLVGEGELRTQLTKLIKELDLTNNIQLLGSRDDVATIDKALNIFVVSSIIETAGLVVLESMASECAVITTDCGGPTEIIRNEENGLVVPIKDSNALAGAIIRMLEDLDLRKRLVKKAKLDSEQYDIKNVAERIENLYKTIYAQKKS